MIFVKAAKAVGLGVGIIPLAGCAVGTSIIFYGFLRAIVYAPDMEDTLFIYTLLGFGLVETFAFIMIAFLLVIIIV